MKTARGNAIAVLVSANILFWLTDAVAGTPWTRDAVDMSSIFMALVVAFGLMPDAWNRFWRGGGRQGWQLLMGNVLWLLGWAAFCTWTYICRGEDRPQWMADSALNAYFKYWILGGIVLAYFATKQTGTIGILTPSRVYYFVAGTAFGALMVAAGIQLFWR